MKHPFVSGKNADQPSKQPPSTNSPRKDVRPYSAAHLLTLQRKAGNAAVMKYLSRFQQTAPPVVQRKMGFEFQTDAVFHQKDVETYNQIELAYQSDKDKVFSNGLTKDDLLEETKVGLLEDIDWKLSKKKNLTKEELVETRNNMLESEIDKATLFEIPPDRSGSSVETHRVLEMLRSFKRMDKSYGNMVFQLPGFFHAEIDLGELEFVTEAFEEDADGALQLLTAVTLMQQFAQVALHHLNNSPHDVKTMHALNQMTAARSFESIVQSFGKGSKIPEAGQLYLGSDKLTSNPNFTASPQASIGIGLDKLVEVFELLNASGPTSDRLGGAANYTAIKEGTHKEDRIYKNSVFGAAASAKQNVEGSASLQGFVSLVISYLASALQWFSKQEHYPKMAHRLMARNDFRLMFSQLSETERVKFRTEYGPDTLLELANLKGWKKEDPIYKPGYTSDSDEVIEPDLVPTVQNWIESITQEAPPNEYNKDSLSSLPGQFIGRGMGQSNRMDKASKTSESVVPVFELRGLAKSVPLENWTDIAFEVYQAIMSIKQSFPGMTLEDIKQQSKEKAEQHVFPEVSTLEVQPEPPSATYPIPKK